MMRKLAANIGIFTVIGIVFSLILQILHTEGIVIDSWIGTMTDLTIGDLMVFNVLAWIVLGLVYSFWRN